MARIRSTHPGQWRDQDFVECGFAARLLAIALRNEADDQGIFEWKPKQIKMNCFPGDSVDMGALLAELIKNNIILKFVVENREYGAIRNFRLYQRPKKPNALYPMTNEIRKYVALDGSKGGTACASEDDSSEIYEAEGSTGSPPVRKSDQQMEEEGDKMKEVIDTSLRSVSPPQAAVTITPQPVFNLPDIPPSLDRRARSKPGAEPPGFAEFYAIYPLKKARPAAAKAYAAAIKRASPEAVLDGARRYAEIRRDEPPKFTRHPATWLNQDGWLDEEPTNGNRTKPPTAHDKFFAGAAAFIREQFEEGPAEIGDDSAPALPFGRPLLQA